MVRFSNLCFIIFFIFLTFPIFSQTPGDDLFDDSYVHEIRVTFFHEAFWDSLTLFYQQIYTDDTKKYLPVNVIIDGAEIDSVGFRQKGFYSNWGIDIRDSNFQVIETALKKPFKIDINHLREDQKYNGLSKINFQNAAFDPSLMRDKLSYNILRKAGLHAPRSAYARLYLNDVYWGLYLMVEQIDKTFLDQNFESNKGNLYKAIDAGDLSWNGGLDTGYTYLGKRTNEIENDWSDLINFVNVINNIPLAQTEDSLLDVFDIESFYKTMAVDVLLNNWDSYFLHGRNFYLYNEPKSDKFHWIHWDYNLAFSFWEMQVFPTITNADNGAKQFNQHQFYLTDEGDDIKPLVQKIYENPNFRIQYLNVFSDLLSSNFSSERLNPLIDNIFQLIEPHVKEDTNYFYSFEDFEKSIDEGVFHDYDASPGLKTFITERVNTVKRRVDVLQRMENIKRVKLNEVITLNKSTISDEAGEFDDWIEIYNPTNIKLNLSLYSLTDDTNDPFKWVFPDTFIQAKEYMILWADNDTLQGKLHTNFKLKNDERLQLFYRVNHNKFDLISSIKIPSLDENQSYGLDEANPHLWIEYSNPTPGGSNSAITAITEEPEEIVKTFSLSDNYPNPFNPSTTIKYEIATQQQVSLKVYNILGKKVKTLVNDVKTPGRYKVVWDGTNDSGIQLASGIYLYRMETENFVNSKKMILLK